MGMLSRSISIPRCILIFSHASFNSESVFKPKKSILMRPVDSMTCPSYCVQLVLVSLKSGSSAVETGTQSLIGSRQIMKPQAWIPVPRIVPSSIFAYLMVLASLGSFEVSASRSIGTALMALVRFIFGVLPSTSGNRSGIALQSSFDCAKGSFSTRATSLMEFFVAMEA